MLKFLNAIRRLVRYRDMGFRFLDRQREMKIRRAIAVGQLVSQSEYTRVDYWLGRDSESVSSEEASRPQIVKRKQRKRETDAPGAVAAAG